MDLTPNVVAAADTAHAASPKSIQTRPEVPQRVQGQVKDWWVKTDNLVQRANALWEFREANK